MRAAEHCPISILQVHGGSAIPGGSRYGRSTLLVAVTALPAVEQPTYACTKPCTPCTYFVCSPCHKTITNYSYITRIATAEILRNDSKMSTPANVDRKTHTHTLHRLQWLQAHASGGALILKYATVPCGATRHARAVHSRPRASRRPRQTPPPRRAWARLWGTKAYSTASCSCGAIG